MILPFAMIAVVLLFNNANISRAYTIQAWSICACLLFYCFGNAINSWHELFLNLLLWVGAFYVITTILSMLIPMFFYRVCIPFFSGYGYADKMIALYQQGYITGFTPNYSMNAMYLAVTFGAYISIAFAKNFMAQKYNIMALLSFSCVLFTGKRAHSIILIVAVLVLYLSIHCDEPIKKWGKVLIILAISALAFSIAVQLIPQLLNVINRFIETSEAGDIEMGRGITRSLAIELWLEHPLLGNGWDFFKYYYNDLTGIFINVHCVYVQLLCEVGIIGTFIFIAFFVSSLVKAIYLLRKMTLDKESDYYKHLAIIYSVYIQVFFIIYCFTGNPLYDEPTLFTYLIGCSMSEYYWLRREKIQC